MRQRDIDRLMRNTLARCAIALSGVRMSGRVQGIALDDVHIAQDMLQQTFDALKAQQREMRRARRMSSV